MPFALRLHGRGHSAIARVARGRPRTYAGAIDIFVVRFQRMDNFVAPDARAAASRRDPRPSASSGESTFMSINA